MVHGYPKVVPGTLKWFPDVLELFRVISMWFRGSREWFRDTLQLLGGGSVIALSDLVVNWSS